MQLKWPQLWLKETYKSRYLDPYHIWDAIMTISKTLISQPRSWLQSIFSNPNRYIKNLNVVATIASTLFFNLYLKTSFVKKKFPMITISTYQNLFFYVLFKHFILFMFNLILISLFD